MEKEKKEEKKEDKYIIKQVVKDVDFVIGNTNTDETMDDKLVLLKILNKIDRIEKAVL